LVPVLSALKHGADLDTPSFSHRMISAYLATGNFPAHLAAVRREYRARRDAMLAALERHLAGAVSWNRPAGGMFLLADLPPGVGAGRLVRSAIAEEQVAFSPGAAFADDGTADHCLRLAFANHSPEEIEEGIARLARALERVLHATYSETRT